MDPIGVLILITGLFSLCGAVFDWNWFMEARKARFVVSLLGRTGARIFYGLLGVGLAAVGLLSMTGTIHMRR